jgi:lipoprotein-releasing system permease protein
VSSRAPFEWIVAVRFLREGRTQSLLILAGVSVGVGVIVFLSALIGGLQRSIVERTLGTQAHIVVRPPDEEPRRLREAAPETPLSQVERPPQRLRSIVGWQQVAAAIEALPGVVATAATVAGPAFAVRGTASKSVAVRGVEPESYQRIVDVSRGLQAGHFRLTGFQAVLGAELARDLGLRLGDKVRLDAATGRSGVFTVVGLFDLGVRDLNERWVFVPLRAGQTLPALEGGVSTLEVKLDDIFAAADTADRIAERTGLVAESWTKINAQLLVALRSQSSSSIMIQAFVIIAVALGIASVLAISVVQKSREIGILKAMGTPTRRVVRVFLLQGALLGVAGSALGLLLGTALALFFARLATNPDGSATFPVDLTAELFVRASLIATLTGVLAAALPARRAARLDPAEVIRYG